MTVNSAPITAPFYWSTLTDLGYSRPSTAATTEGRPIGHGFWWSCWSATISGGSLVTEIAVSTFCLAIARTVGGKGGCRRISIGGHRAACLSGHYGGPGEAATAATLAVCLNAAIVAVICCTTAPH